MCAGAVFAAFMVYQRSDYEGIWMQALTVISFIFVASLSWLVAGTVPSTAAVPFGQGLFGSSETALKNKKEFGQWADMWRRHTLSKRSHMDENRQKRNPPEQPAAVGMVKCVGRMKAYCNQTAWEKFIQENQGKPVEELLPLVNDYINRSRYIVDPVNWGLPDYWATPQEFMLKDGDCEDYAISKYITLKRLDVDVSALRLVVVQDENLRVAHAVLAAYVGDSIQILDNQVKAVVPHEQILHYRPVYSVNESGWWLHQRKRFGR